MTLAVMPCTQVEGYQANTARKTTTFSDESCEETCNSVGQLTLQTTTVKHTTRSSLHDTAFTATQSCTALQFAAPASLHFTS